MRRHCGYAFRDMETRKVKDLEQLQSLYDEALDLKVSVRYQTTFLPVDEEEEEVEDGEKKGKNFLGRDRASLEFATEAYNYQTHSDEDPRNLILLCTTQGTALQQDGRGAHTHHQIYRTGGAHTQKLFHHQISSSESKTKDVNGKTTTTTKVTRHWLEAERSSHKVGGQQVESNEEIEDALKRGKAVAKLVGPQVPAFGTRFNALMTIQVPLEQVSKPLVVADMAAWTPPALFGGINPSGLFGGGAPAPAAAAFSSSSTPYSIAGATSLFASANGGNAKGGGKAGKGGGGTSIFGSQAQYSSSSVFAPQSRQPQLQREGTSNAARVSVGSQVDEYKGLSLAHVPKRNPSEHITVTVIMYYTVAGGVPTEEDVVRAIDDLEALYAESRAGRLGTDPSKKEAFTKELTVADVKGINAVGANLVESPFVRLSYGDASISIDVQSLSIDFLYQTSLNKCYILMCLT